MAATATTRETERGPRMRLQLSSDSRVFIDLRATGLLRAVGHDPTLTARPDTVWFEVEDPDAVDLPVVVPFRTERIEAAEDLPPSDRAKMRDNLRSAEVLDVARFPTIELRARYRGSIERGRLEGELVVRGSPRRVAVDVVIARDGYARTARGTWAGRLTDLGIKPFKALMGALRLEDWIQLRVEARLVQEG
jgi:polyisoprenoid-binding protein YceI